MTKHFVLSISYQDGSRGAACDSSAVPLVLLAREIRASGAHDGKPVSGGVILSNVKPPMSAFSCRAAVAAVVDAAPKTRGRPRKKQ